MMKKIIYTIIAIALFGSLTSCDKDLLDPTLAQNKAVETSINTAADLQGILLGAYNRMTSSSYYGRNAIIYGEVRSDNAFSDGNSGRFLVSSEMTYTDSFGGVWNQLYSVIAVCNVLLGIDLETIEGDATEINHILGQALAIRAMAHFDLVRFHGSQHSGGSLGVAYVKTYKGDEESLAPSRATVAENKADIMADLSTAASMMSTSLNDPSKQYMTTHGANALAARVALYFGDWSTASSMANSVISSGAYSIVPAAQYAASFYTDGTVNSIFELAYSTTDNNNINGLSQIYRGNAYGDIRALPSILDIFDDNDVRGGVVAGTAMIDWDPDPDYAYKLRNMGKYPSEDYSDNISLIRYEEVLLIYAEASFESGNASTALTYINMLAAARGADAHTVANATTIAKERRRELCFEGFRFDDLARYGREIPNEDATGIITPVAYGNFRYAFPIPRSEILANSNMVQNPGY